MLLLCLPVSKYFVSQVYITAIKGHVPDDMVKCLATFMEICYLVRQDEISVTELDAIQIKINQFHQLRQVFIDTGVRVDISLPRQHSLMHYPDSITLFGSPNGLCSSITESKHIKAVKEPWRRSNRNKPLLQMLATVTRMEKVEALRVIFDRLGMLNDSSLWESDNKLEQDFVDDNSDEEGLEVMDIDTEPVRGLQCDVADVDASNALKSDTSISLAVKRRTFYLFLPLFHALHRLLFHRTWLSSSTQPSCHRHWTS